MRDKDAEEEPLDGMPDFLELSANPNVARRVTINVPKKANALN